MNLVDQKLKVYEIIHKNIRAVFGGIIPDDLFITMVNEIDKVYQPEE